jgi:hypothetical protein
LQIADAAFVCASIIPYRFAAAVMAGTNHFFAAS